MHAYLLDYLACPACHGPLEWDVVEQLDGRIELAQIRCTGCAADFFVRDGIGVFLLPDLPRNDLWEQELAGLADYLQEHPDVERRLMQAPVESLSPADQFFRALVMEEEGDFLGAEAVIAMARSGLYTPEFQACLESQMDFVINYLGSADGPILDLASGRGILVERLARELDQPVIASDFSLRVLRRNRGWLKSTGLLDRVSLLAFDARQTPFKDAAIPTMTTNQGLANIEKPGDLLEELRRIVSGVFLAIAHGYPEADRENWEAIRELRFDERMISLREARRLFAEAKWEVEVANRCAGRAEPTPAGVILEGAKIDALPVVETTLEWCVLVGG